MRPAGPALPARGGAGLRVKLAMGVAAIAPSGSYMKPWIRMTIGAPFGVASAARVSASPAWPGPLAS
jgi:hypothetical protein